MEEARADGRKPRGAIGQGRLSGIRMGAGERSHTVFPMVGSGAWRHRSWLLALHVHRGDLLGTRPRASHPIEPGALVGLILGGGYVIGMFVALKWERAGAILAGASLGLLAIGLLGSGLHSHRDPALAALWGSIFGVLVFLPVVLYILCWWLEDRDRKRYRAGS